MAARTVLVCALAVASVLGGIRPARAQVVQQVGLRRPVAVIVLDYTPGTRALAEKLDGALGTHAELQPISSSDTAALLDELTETDESQQLAEVRAIRDRAEQALAQYQFRDIPPYVGDAQAKLLQLSPRAAVPLYADFMFLLGVAFLGDGKPIDAAAAFVLVKKLDPARTVDAARYVPEVVRAFDASRPSLSAVATLAVKGRGRVWIDGDEVGAAPGDFKVPYGTHVVWITGPERETRGRAVPFVAAGARLDVPVPDADESRRAKLQHARRAIAEAPDPAARSTAMRHLAELAGVHDAVLLSSANGRVIAQSWRDRAPGFSALREISPGDRASAVLDLLAPPPPPPPELPPELPVPVAKRWYQKPSVQLSTGAVLVLAAIVGFVVWERRPPGLNDVDPNAGFIVHQMSRH